MNLSAVSGTSDADLRLRPGQRPCRSCRAELKHSFVDLGMSPLANSNLEATQLNQMEPFYPLHAYVCEECFLVQLEEFESPQHIFGDYVYLSSYSQSWVQHAKDYVEMIVARLGLSEKSQVVEIASNDGYLLQWFVAKGIPALGIEPAANIAKIAVENGIPTQARFFNTETAKELTASGLQADLIIGNNVLAHVPELNDFVAGLRILLTPTGVATFEFPHLLRLMEGRQFDTIYHEHFSYFSLHAVARVFARHGLTIFDVEELATHGGSLRIYAARAADASKPVNRRVGDLLSRERQHSLTLLDRYLSFAGEVAATKRALLQFLIRAKGEGKSIVGYGAPAKGNTLLNYCGIRTDFIDYVVDLNPYKQGRFLPGSRIPIHHPDRIRETRPDYLLLLPWNLRDEIMGQMAHVRDWGCRFVTPLPEVRVYD
jgi:2-polyprenyl-3-methyl-5-hydroxy-6-metoxy-1,4-benzoquinol methylase